MDFNGYGLPKITECAPHVPPLDSVPESSILGNVYQSTIDKNDLQSLNIQDNHGIHENPDSPPEADGKK